jgi:hypothetical protein
MYIYKYFQLRINISQHHVSVTPVTIIRLSYNKNTINIQIFFKKSTIKSLDVTPDFSIAHFTVIKHQMILSLKYGNSLYLCRITV